MTLYEQAEQMRKAGQYDQALALFQQLWQARPAPSLGRQVGFCLRKLKRLAEAERHLREALQQFPQDQYTKSELGWTLYERYIKPDDESLSCEIREQYAQEILTLCPENDLLLKRTTMEMAQFLRKRNRYDQAIRWYKQIRKEDLSAEPRTIEGKAVMSELETYYIGFSQCLLKTQRFPESATLAEEGLRQFPNSLFLKRNYASALHALGQMDEAIALMRSLLKHPRADWYIRSDLAEMELAAGNASIAYQLLCEVFLTTSRRQEIAYLVGMLFTLAEAAVAINLPEEALAYLALAEAVRVREGWSVPKDLVALKQKVIDALPALPSLPDEVVSLTHHCKQIARRHSPTRRGRVLPFQPERPFTFIEEEGTRQRFFVHRRTLDKHRIQPEDPVEFITETSWDEKKGVYAPNVAFVRKQSGNLLPPDPPILQE